MLEVRISINGRVIAEARALNVSDLAPLSDYEVTARTAEHPATGRPYMSESFRVLGHQRGAGAWALVARIAGTMAHREMRALARAAIRALPDPEPHGGTHGQS